MAPSQSIIAPAELKWALTLRRAQKLPRCKQTLGTIWLLQLLLCFCWAKSAYPNMPTKLRCKKSLSQNIEDMLIGLRSLPRTRQPLYWQIGTVIGISLVVWNSVLLHSKFNGSITYPWFFSTGYTLSLRTGRRSGGLAPLGGWIKAAKIEKFSSCVYS